MPTDIGLHRNINKKPLFARTPALCVFALFCCALWGSAYTVVKVGANLFEVIQLHAPSMILFAGIRFFIAGILTVIFGSFIQRKPLMLRRRSVFRQ